MTEGEKEGIRKQMDIWKEKVIEYGAYPIMLVTIPEGAQGLAIWPTGGMSSERMRILLESVIDNLKD